MSPLDSPIPAILPTKHASQRWMTTPQVANALERSGMTLRHVKTVQRRLEALFEDGVVVKRTAGNALEWQKKEDASGVAAKAGAMMTFDEALALQTLKRFAVRQIPTLVGGAVAGLFEVAEERLTRSSWPVGRRHANWHKKVAAVDSGFQLLAPKSNRVRGALGGTGTGWPLFRHTPSPRSDRLQDELADLDAWVPL